MSSPLIRIVRVLFIPLVLLILSFSTTTLAWHAPNEAENRKHGALGGDPRVLEDMEPCLEETQGTNGTTCSVLYAHFLDLLVPLLNTQRPAECAVDLARGFTGAPGVGPHWSYSRMDFIVNDGFIEYPDQDQGECNDPSAYWNRESGDDVHIAADAPITAYWYLSADSLEFSPLGVGTGRDSALPSMGAMPCLTVRVALETGRISGAGEVLTEGTTTKTVLSTPYGHGSSDLPVEDPCPDSEGMITAQEVTEFRVGLEPLEHSFDMRETFVFLVQWYQHDGTSGDPVEEDNLVQNDWNLRSGSDHRNRFVLPVKKPLQVLDMRVLEGDERLDPPRDSDAPPTDHQIRLILRSSWGANDIDEKNIRFQAVHENGTITALEHIADPVDAGYHGHYNPRNLTFDWDPRADGLEAGAYTLRAVVPNWQHTAQTEAETLFVIEGEAGVQSRLLPAHGFVAIVLLLGLLVALARGSRSSHGPSR